MNKSYQIKEGYIHKTGLPAPTQTNAGAKYWKDHRIETSNYYQYFVYTKALSEAKKKFGDNISVIDVGCGSGSKLAKIVAPNAKYSEGVDQPYIMERASKMYPSIEWTVNDLGDPNDPLIKKSDYNLIICADVIEHLLDPDVLLYKIKKIMNHNSIIVLSTPERDILRGKDNNQSPHPEHIREWNTAELESYMNHSGFEVLEMVNLHALKPMLSKLYVNFLRRHFGRTNSCMTCIAKLRQ